MTEPLAALKATEESLPLILGDSGDDLGFGAKVSV